ncbi:MAG: hypothetical protein KatS3mg050_3207 [Litorilinea sp.]|nr:MAG: hypothetical protein KatS3mg050_3207 [Litorilinea sp.]
MRAARGKGELATYFDIELLAEMFLAPLTAPYWQYLVEVRGFTKERLCAGLRTLVHTPPGSVIPARVKAVLGVPDAR